MNTNKKIEGSRKGLSFFLAGFTILAGVGLYALQTSGVSLPSAGGPVPVANGPAAPDNVLPVSTERDRATIEAVDIDAGHAEPAPEPTRPETFSEKASGLSDLSGVAGYVLGAEGISPDMQRAWLTLERARASGADTQEKDPQMMVRAAQEIGYVPAGMDPDSIRDPSEPIGARGGEIVSGSAEVVAADRIIIGGVLLRLQGLRAPGPDDLCKTASGREYDCGAWASKALEALIAGRELSCELRDRVADDGAASVGWCSIVLRSGVGRDVGQIEVEAGIAIAEGADTGISPYLRSAQKARHDKVGIWTGSVSKREIRESEK